MRTLALIKCQAVALGNLGRIVAKIENDTRFGLRVTRLELVDLDIAGAERLYSEHRGRPHFNRIVASITGRVAVMVLEGQNAVQAWREMMGPTDPAAPGAHGLRSIYGERLPHNALHGSDGEEAAEWEIAQFFPDVTRPAIPPAIQERAVAVFQKLDAAARIPTRAHALDAGLDLYALADTAVEHGFVTKIRTGIAVAVPPGYELQIRGRSGMAAAGLHVVNSPATVDAGYRGELFVLMTSHAGPYAYPINKGDRVAQLVFQKLPDLRIEEADRLPPSPDGRGTGGGGSTGR